MTGIRPLGQLLRIAAVIVVCWTAFAVFSASHFRQISVDTGFTPNQAWVPLLGYNLTVGLLWAFATPFIIYAAERFPLGKPFRWRNALVLLAFTPLAAFLRASCGGAVMVLVEDGLGTERLWQFVEHSVIARFTRNVFLTIIVIGIVNLIIAQRRAGERERELLALKKQLADDEVQRLRAVMQPHVFGAALDAAKEQVRTAPAIADRMLVDLGVLLRHLLQFEQRDEVRLGEELELVDKCLAWERTRTADAGAVAFDVPEILLSARIPPLLLYGIVEPVTSADAPRRERVHIEAWPDHGKLKLLVRNEGSSRSLSDVAVKATQARLRRAAGDRASLVMHSYEGGNEVIVTLPLLLGDAAPAQSV